MQSSNVFICGMGGLGVEIAKNIVLGGVKSVTIHDDTNVSYRDLSSQVYSTIFLSPFSNLFIFKFFLTKADIGKNRAECTQTHLAELNVYVPVNIHQGEITEDCLKHFQVKTIHHSPSLSL